MNLSAQMKNIAIGAFLGITISLGIYSLNNIENPFGAIIFLICLIVVLGGVVKVSKSTNKK